MRGATWPITVMIITIAAMVFIAYGIGRSQSDTVTIADTIVVDGSEIILHQQSVIQRLQNQIDNFDPEIIKVPVPGETEIDTIEVKVYPVVKDSLISEPYLFQYTGERLQFNTDIVTTTTYELFMDEEGEFYRQFHQSLAFDNINYIIQHEVKEVRIPARFNLYSGAGLGYGDGELDWNIWLGGIVNETYLMQLQRARKTTWLNVGTKIFGW